MGLRMRVRHKIFSSAAFAVAVAASPILPALADDAVSLTSVARELGFSYAYLPYENAVSLSRPGATVVVRPGDPFFSANERREPVYGIVPEYRRNDVYVSRAFIDEIRDLGRRAGDRASTAGVASAIVPMRPAPVQPPSGSVTTLAAAYDPTDDAILVRGSATAGSRVALAVKATLSESLPIVTVDRLVTYAGADGNFVASLSFGSDHFAQSRYVVEAAGSGNAAAVVAPVPARVPSAAMHTTADDRR
ncbi:MAG: hypothetical protein NVSMB19_19120 [Vulcanimicrobiaceae bacterium]